MPNEHWPKKSVAFRQEKARSQVGLQEVTHVPYLWMLR